MWTPFGLHGQFGLRRGSTIWANFTSQWTRSCSYARGRNRLLKFAHECGDNITFVYRNTTDLERTGPAQDPRCRYGDMNCLTDVTDANRLSNLAEPISGRYRSTCCERFSSPVDGTPSTSLHHAKTGRAEQRDGYDCARLGHPINPNWTQFPDSVD